MSIDCRELRIGNVVSVNGKFDVIVIEIDCNGITYDRIDYSEVAAHVEYKYLQPIKLKTEILEKCGFDYKVNGFNHEFRRGKFDGDYLDFYLLNRHEPASYYELIHLIGKVVLVSKIWHLHHLQNIYYSLNRTELEPKL